MICRQSPSDSIIAINKLSENKLKKEREKNWLKKKRKKNCVKKRKRECQNKRVVETK